MTTTQNTSPIVILYTTLPSEDAAHSLAQGAVEARLAACAQILQMKSVYMWNSDLQKDTESLLLLKTNEQNYTELKKFILDRHPYEVPCLLKIQTADFHQAYLQWVLSGLKG